MRTVLWIAAFVLSIASSAEAQPRRFGEPMPPGAERRAGMAERREQIKKKIRAMRAYTLTEELALDERTASRLFPVLSRYDDETDKLLEKRVELRRRLRHAETLGDPRAIDKLIDDAVANQRSLWDLEDRRIADLRKILTPSQTAKLLVVLPALERKIERQLRRATTPRLAEPAIGGSANDIDDDRELDEMGPPPAGRNLRRGAAPSYPRSPQKTPRDVERCDPFSSVLGCR